MEKLPIAFNDWVLATWRAAVWECCISEGLWASAYRWNHGLVLFPGPAAKKGDVPAPAQGGRLGAATGSDEVTVTGASLRRCKAKGSGCYQVG